MVNVIANMFPNSTDRQEYQHAAASFRLPYWDWSKESSDGDEHFPEVFWEPSIYQRGPKGAQVISNPLYSYAFHPKDEEAFIWSPVISLQVIVTGCSFTHANMLLAQKLE